jgi:DDE superfamily endonuclease
MDEKGFMLGVLKKTRRIVNINLLKQGKIKGAGQDGNRSWITLIASVCCDGSYLPATLIYKGAGGLQIPWLDDFHTETDIAYFTSTPTGYTNEDIGYQWLTKTFNRVTRPKARNGRDWRLLWVDGHNSHINMRFLDWCHKHRVLVAMFPSHSTHRLQPLDVSCFSPLAIRYSQHLDQWIAKHGGIVGLNQSDFYGLFKLALQEAFTEKNILSAWRRTGLHPFNPAIVLDQLAQTPPPTENDSIQQPLSEQIEWRKMRRVLQQDKQNPLNQVILQGFETLSAQNVLLKAEIDGLRSLVKLQKRRAVRSRNVFEKIIDEDGNKAIFFSPKKIKRARELQQEKDDAIEQEQREKEERAQERVRVKERKAVELQQRREERERARLEREKLKAVKKDAQEAARTQREVNKQLKSDVQSAGRSKKTKASQLEAASSIDRGVAFNKAQTEVVVHQTRSGRTTRPKKHFDDM